ncbi:MAG: hypothetical protein H0U67_14925 [Gemmatimonadetes bacterium]|nr:hypothetical protein [Gemmatimonadota bacterium]
MIDEEKRRRLAKRDENRRREMENLRLFQANVEATMDAIEHDFGEFDRMRRLGENIAGWLPFRAYNAVREADKQAVWVADSGLIPHWKRIRDNVTELLAAIEAQRFSASVPEPSRAAFGSIYQDAFATMRRNRDAYIQFNEVLEAAVLSIKHSAGGA